MKAHSITELFEMLEKDPGFKKRNALVESILIHRDLNQGYLLKLFMNCRIPDSKRLEIFKLIELERLTEYQLRDSYLLHSLPNGVKEKIAKLLVTRTDISTPTLTLILDYAITHYADIAASRIFEIEKINNYEKLYEIAVHAKHPRLRQVARNNPILSELSKSLELCEITPKK